MSDAFIAPNFDNIPVELRQLPNWVTWKDEGNPGEKPRKVPYPPGRPNTRGSSTDPSTWGTFEQAMAAYLAGGLTGIGIVLNGTGLVGVDIDHCVVDGLPDPADRGAFMGINSSVAQVSGGIATAVAGMIVVKTESGYLENYPMLGIVVTVAMIITMAQLYKVNKALRERRAKEIVENEITK